MSFKAIFDFFLHIHSLSNIDLPSQGLFRLRASVYQLDGTKVLDQQRQKIYAIPFQFMQPSKKQSHNSKKIFKRELIQPPYFFSKTGAIRYAGLYYLISDDVVILEDLIRFKLDVESFPRLHSENIYIQFDLYFSECYYSSSIHQFDGTKVQTKTFKLENIEHGILNYCEAQFVGDYSSKVAFTMFACLSDFKFGKYNLPQEVQAICRQDIEGNIKSQFVKPMQNVRQKQLQRSKLKTFEQFLKWVDKHYKGKVSDPLKYFYHTYVKNLRYYFYQAQQKLNSKSIITRKLILKVPKKYLQLPEGEHKQNLSQETEVGEKQFRKYMTDYEPENLKPISIQQQINTIHFDIYLFLMEVEKQFQLDQLMLKKMRQQYGSYITERYGERVFKSTVHGDDCAVSSRENKKIAKNMREKEKRMKLVNYPIQDISYLQGKDLLQFLFYQIAFPKENRKQSVVVKSVKSTNQINVEQKKEKEETQQINNQQNILISKQMNQQINKDNSFFQKQSQKPEKQVIRNVIKQKQDQLFLNSQKNELLNSIQKFPEEKQNLNQEKEVLKNKITQQKNPSEKSSNEQEIHKSTINLQQQQVEALQFKKFYSDEQGKHNLNDDEDIYKNVSHEKGQVDSELSQRSLDHHQYQVDHLNSQFSGISDIALNARQINKSNAFQASENLPDLIYDEKNMLVVMCHGFQGSSFDMTVVVKGIKQLLPQASYLISRANEGRTEENIDQMGQRLAQEVQNYVKNYMDRDTVIINFVGHSMGGVIARAGIKYLPKIFSNQFGFFCSLSTPHLGYLTGVDGMIKAGLWAILKFKSITSLRQLTMEDEKDVRKTFLYKLSKEGNLKRFRRIILLSSFQDSYVPWHSARISLNNSKKNSRSGKIQEQMVSSILGSQPIHRIDVNFNVKTKNLDSFIGRTAHINLIVQQSLFKIIKSTMPDLFNLSKQ